MFMRRKRALSGLILTVMAAGVVAPAAGAEPRAVATPGAAQAGPTVTLLTGDKVTVGGVHGVSVRAGKGREHVTFFTETDEHGDTTVVPEDALSLLSQGKLDPRLFDVTELVRAGYDDASRSTLPLIVDYAGPTPRSAAAKVSRELPVLSATAVSVDRSGAYWQTARMADHVWLDGQVRASLDKSVPQIGAPEAWAAGYTGAGTTVAVLDTGIDATHPDLSDAIAGAKNFTGSDTIDDRVGHGTHVASTITGNGARYQGVAPDAKLLNGKVLNDEGRGSDSGIIAGMEWAANSGADVINMSLGGFLPSDGTDPMSQALNRITAETGALFVVAAGNSGPAAGWISGPGAADAALTVGAVDRNDELADFSSRGPRFGDSAIKPDITAPGVNIVAARAANGQDEDPDGDGYVSMSGTSMATPHVAGAAAIVAGQHPDWTAGQLKAALMATAKPGDYTVFEQGAGRVDVAKAIMDTVFASSGNLGFGLAQWPHDDDQPTTKTVTYTNTGTDPVTLDLVADITGQDGSAAPQGMFTIEPTHLTVPAGGQASANVTADTTVDGPDGVFEGTVTAAGGGQSLRTPIAVNREVESYDVTVKALDYNGSPTEDVRARFVSVARPDKYHPYVYKPFEDGTVTMRLPKGEYTYTAVVQQLFGEDYHNAQFVEPAFMVTGDTEVVLDARDTKPAGFTVDNPNVKPTGGGFGFERRTEWGLSGASASWPADGSTTLKPSATGSDAFTFTAEAHFARPDGAVFDGSPSAYHIRHVDHAVPQSLDWHDKSSDLAKVRSQFASTRPGTFGGYGAFVFPLPGGTMTEYYSPDVPWDAGFEELLDPEGTVVVSASSQYERVSFPRGRTVAVRWGFGVFGPAMGGSTLGGDHADRNGDLLRFSVPLVTDPVPGRIGYLAGDGRAQLLRDGQVIGEGDGPLGGWFDVGPERAVYTLRTSTDRASFARLSTKISAEWTFPSERVERAAVPLLAVSFAPNVDNHNAAPAGRRFTIPVRVQRNGSDEIGGVNTPAVEVSYDDGTTWRPANVKRDHGQWQATVDHPKGAEFVSLRSNVTDQNGFAQHLTIIRAYALA
jgi:subtilisin family serine protease